MLRPSTQSEQMFANSTLLCGDAPKLLGDKRHEWMQKLENFIERPGRGGARLAPCCAVRTCEHRLDQLEIPVAVDVPDEAINRRGRFVEFISLDRRGNIV